MANYEATARSNYFHVTDEEKFHQIFEQIQKKNFGIELFTGSDHTYGFGSYSDVDMDDIFELQDINRCFHGHPPYFSDRTPTSFWYPAEVRSCWPVLPNCRTGG